jgi:tetratricopeptide (TPR) repeat protein
LVWVMAAVFICGAANPLGFYQYQYVISHVRSDTFMYLIEEWNQPTWQKHAGFFIGMGVIWLLQLATIRKSRISDLLLLAGFSYFAIKSFRNLPLFYLAALPPLAGNLRILTEKRANTWKFSLAAKRAGYGLGIGLALAICLITSQKSQTFHLGKILFYYPEDATEWVLKQPLAGRLMAQLHWSDYLSWRSQGKIKIYMDGRLAMFGEKTFREFTWVFSGDAKYCHKVLEKYQIQILLVDIDKERQLSARLDESRQWALVYFDDLAQVYLKRNGPNQTLINQYEYKAIAPWKPLPYKFGQEVPGQALQEARRAVQMAPHSYLPLFYLGQILMHDGVYREAEENFQAVLKIDPRQYAAYYNLAFIALQQADTARARKNIQRALSLCPKDSARDQLYQLRDKIEGY